MVAMPNVPRSWETLGDPGGPRSPGETLGIPFSWWDGCDGGSVSGCPPGCVQMPPVTSGEKRRLLPCPAPKSGVRQAPCTARGCLAAPSGREDPKVIQGWLFPYFSVFPHVAFPSLSKPSP